MSSPDLSRSPNLRNRVSDAAVDPVTSEVKEEELRQLNVIILVEMRQEMRRPALDQDLTLRNWCIKVFQDTLAK